MELMTSMGQRMLASSKSLRANKDLESITNDARAIRGLASKITTLFPPGSTQFPTAAKPAVWQDRDDFTAKAKSLEAESEKLMNTSAKDGESLRVQFRAVAFACDGVTKNTAFPRKSIDEPGLKGTEYRVKLYFTLYHKLIRNNCPLYQLMIHRAS